MDRSRVETLLKYILLTAADSDWDRRWLGPIHLIKYVYIADFAYAKVNKGETYTGIEWRFHKFGPWSYDLYDVIISEGKPDAILDTPAIYKMKGVSDFDKDYRRWSLSDETLRKKLESEIDSVFVSAALKRWLRQYGNDTYGLLQEIYSTMPMLKAAPGEILDFTPIETEAVRSEKSEPEKPKELSKTQMKLAEERHTQLKEKFKTKLAAKLTRKNDRVQITPPRYDDVYEEGVSQLDDFETPPIDEIEGTLEISNEVWKSPSRTDELP